LPLKSAGVPDFADASAASTSARVISALVISGEERSRWRSISWAWVVPAKARTPIASTQCAPAIISVVLDAVRAACVWH